jgi:hypothetical protein
MQTKTMLTTALCVFFLCGLYCADAQNATAAQSPSASQDATAAQSPSAEEKLTPEQLESLKIAQDQADRYARYKRSVEMEEQQEYLQQQQVLENYRTSVQNEYARQQQQPQNSRTRSYSASNYDPARQNYDPAAGPNAQKQSWTGALDAATGHINPCNHDWGGLLAEWHIAVAQETIENAYFYVCGIQLICILLLFLWVSELRSERTERLAIAGAVVTQLYNQYVTARNKAYETIYAYNRLVEQTEDRIDALMRGEAPDEKPSNLPVPNISSASPVNILDSQTISDLSSTDEPEDKERAATGTDKIAPSSQEPILDKFKQIKKPSIPLTALGHVGETSGSEIEVPYVSRSNDDISLEEELEAKRRQIETLQARLQNKNLRINELEDALAVSANNNKFPEL